MVASKVSPVAYSCTVLPETFNKRGTKQESRKEEWLLPEQPLEAKPVLQATESVGLRTCKKTFVQIF